MNNDMYILGLRERRMGIALVLSLTVLVSSSSAKTHKRQRALNGTWGGDHIGLEVTGRSAVIDYDCARGTIDGPLVIDRNGNFKLSGTYIREHGGPIRRGESANARRARYSGWTDGKKMTLSVVLSDPKETVGTFSLTRGQQGHLWKCK
jgi:hypothetical protein